MKKILSLAMIILIAFQTISFVMPNARAETDFPRPALPDGPEHTNELVDVINANTTNVLIVTEGYGPLTGVSPIAEKDFWVDVLADMTGDFDVDWFDGVPSSALLSSYDLVIYDAGGYWYPLSGGITEPLEDYHFSGKPLIVVAPDINYDWQGSVPSFCDDVLHIEGVLGIMPEAVYDIYADTGHDIVYRIPKDVGIGIPAVTSWPDCFDPKADCESVLTQGYIPETEFGVGTCSGLPSYSSYDPEGKLFATVAYPSRGSKNNIISDAEYRNQYVSVAQIQEFLDKWNSYLANYKTTDWQGVKRSAAEIIYNAAHGYSINPEVILTTLQKEKGLITAEKPKPEDLNWAMGYAIDNLNYKGFGKQVHYAAWQFDYYWTAYLDKGKSIPTDPAWGVGITTKTQDGIFITPQNKATAALYAYTPHAGQGWGGTGGGNYLFWNLYYNMFGFAEGRTVTFGVPLSGLENTKIAKQLAKDSIEWALQEELVDIDLTLYIEDAVKALVNKAPGDKIDIVAAVANKEKDPYDIDVVFEVPSDLSFDKGFTRNDFHDIDGEPVTPAVNGKKYTVTISLGGRESRQVVLRFDISESALTTVCPSVFAKTIVGGTVCSSTVTMYNMVDNAKALIVTNRHLLIQRYGLDERIDKALSWAFSKLDSPEYPYECVKFVQDAYDIGADKVPPIERNDGDIKRYGYAKQAADVLDAQKNVGKPPRGVFVFYDWKGWVDLNENGVKDEGETKNWGHVGLSCGDGNVIHALGKVRVDTYRKVEELSAQGKKFEYIGWAWPPLSPSICYRFSEELLSYLYKISDWREQNCIIYYVDHYDDSLKDWDQSVDYTKGETEANVVANKIDDLIEKWHSQTSPEYLMIVGGDEVIPFFRLDDSNYYDTEDNHPYNSDDPVLNTFDENYFLSDNPYADTSGDDYDEGRIELSIGRIVGSSTQDMKDFITAGLSRPEDLDIAIVMHDETVDDAVGALDEKASSIAQSDTWTDNELEHEMEQGFQILYCVCHGEYHEISAVGGGTLDDDELDDVDSTGGISNNRPITIFDACRVGVVTDENEEQWAPEWDDCMIYALVHQGNSGIVAAGAKVIFDYGVKLTNDFISRLITDSQESLPFGTALRDAKVHYDKGLSWSGGEKKTVTEFIYYGVPWTTIDPQGMSQESDSSTLISISNPSYVGDETYARTIEINATHFVVSKVNGFDLIEINGAQQALDEQRPVIPTVEIMLSLPLDSNVVDIALMDDVKTQIGFFNIPSFISAEKPEESILVPSAGLEFYPSPTYLTDILTVYHQKIAKIRIALVQYNPETQETIFYNYTKLQVTYQTAIPLTIRELVLEKKECAPGESVKALVMIESVTSEVLLGLHVNLTVKDSHAQVVASASSAPFDLDSGEIKEILILLNQELPHGTYLLEAEVTGSGTLATSSTYIKILSGGIVDFYAPTEVKSGDDITYEVSFMNGKSVDVSGESVIYLHDAHDIEIAELYSSPTTFSANSITQTQITWSTAGKEYGTYTASAMVYVGGESFGPAYHTFEIKPPDDIPPTTFLTIGSPQYVDALGNVYINSSTTLTLNAIDDGGTGSGVALTGYKIHDTSYDSGWITGSPPISFQIGGLDDELYYVDYNSTDNVGNIEETNTTALILDNTGPLITVSNPPAGWALQDGVTFLGSITDSGSGVFSMSFSIREANDGDGNPIGFEDLPASYDPITREWNLSFDTLLVPDGYYVLYIEAKDKLGNETSTTVPYSIRNWAVIELLPSSENNKAGRTMPVKFALRVAAEIDPDQPFVYNEELRIEIFATADPDNILQESYYGNTARDYRISGVHYITNFKTIKRTPMEYTVAIYRDTFDVGSFTFETVK